MPEDSHDVGSFVDQDVGSFVGQDVTCCEETGSSVGSDPSSSLRQRQQPKHKRQQQQRRSALAPTPTTQRLFIPKGGTSVPKRPGSYWATLSSCPGSGSTCSSGPSAPIRPRSYRASGSGNGSFSRKFPHPWNPSPKPELPRRIDNNKPVCS